MKAELPSAEGCTQCTWLLEVRSYACVCDCTTAKFTLNKPLRLQPLQSSPRVCVAPIYLQTPLTCAAHNGKVCVNPDQALGSQRQDVHVSTADYCQAVIAIRTKLKSGLAHRWNGGACDRCSCTVGEAQGWGCQASMCSCLVMLAGGATSYRLDHISQGSIG